MDSHELLRIALEAAREAGALALSGWRTRPEATHKSRVDLVTRFDHDSERLLRERLTAIAPNISAACMRTSILLIALERGLLEGDTLPDTVFQVAATYPLTVGDDMKLDISSFITAWEHWASYRYQAVGGT